MSYQPIQKFSDFDFIINDSIELTGRHDAIQEEIYHNMWAISFDENYIKTLKSKDLFIFLTQLLTQRSKQITIKYPNFKATFYLWYDEQAGQLRFNILSGDNIRPPFGCTLNIVQSPEPIFKKFLDDMQSEHPPLSWENITILNPGDPGFDDDEDEDNSNYIQDVFVITLPQSNISTFLQNFII